MKILIVIMFMILSACNQVELGLLSSSSVVYQKAELRVKSIPSSKFSVSLGAESLPRLVTIENIGLEDAENLQISLGQDFKYAFGSLPGTNGTCGSKLNKGESCQIEVVFIPSSLGEVQSPLNLNYESLNTPIAKEAVLSAKVLTCRRNFSRHGWKLFFSIGPSWRM